MVVLAVILAALTFAAWDRPYPQTRTGPYLSTQYVQTTNALTAGCSGIFEFPHHPQTGPVDRIRADGQESRYVYTTRVPAYGQYFTVPEPADPDDRFRPAQAPLRPEEGLGLAFEHGWVIVWYDDNARDVDVDNARKWLEANPDAKVVLAYWPDDRRGFPSDRAFAFTAQNVSQSCERFAGFTLIEFIEFADTHKGRPMPDLPRQF